MGTGVSCVPIKFKAPSGKYINRLKFWKSKKVQKNVESTPQTCFDVLPLEVSKYLSQQSKKK